MWKNSLHGCFHLLKEPGIMQRKCCDLQERAFGQDVIKVRGMKWGLWELDAWIGQRTDSMIQVHNSNNKQIWIVLYNTSKEVYITSGTTSFLWDWTWLNFYLKFNSNYLIIDIVDSKQQRNMFIHLNDNLMVFSLYCTLIFLYMPASTAIVLQEILNFRMFGSYLLLHVFDYFLYCIY